MIQWWWLLVVAFIAFCCGYFIYAMMKISADTDRLWESYYQMLKDEKEKENDSISNV